jgi:integrase
LTAARTGEAIGARWPEVDLEARTWTVPAERMKAARRTSCRSAIARSS